MSLTYIFQKQDNDFTDILADPVFKRKIATRVRWTNHLMIQLKSNTDDRIDSYVRIKYSDLLIEWSSIIPDRTPVLGVDYMPDQKYYRYIESKKT